MHPAPHGHSNALPPLGRDLAFWGMTATQFLGAFNDNLFKQLVLLLCVAYVAAEQLQTDRYQPVAQALFALPFVLFSGVGGFLADRHSKRTVVVVCKVAEIAVMGAGLVAFAAAPTGTQAQLLWVFAVLFLMGAQSAFFGPAKYGILPEMLREHDLPAANGVIQMTTFLAIIFGTASAGYAKVWFGRQLWVVSALCMGIAVLGTITSLWVRRTPAANPTLRFGLSAVGINRETWLLVRTDRMLLSALVVSSLFWFVGGVVLPAVNALGELQLKLTADRTSLLAASIGVGIAGGCVLGGGLSRHRVRFGLVRLGAVGIVVSLAAVSLLAVSRLPVALIEASCHAALLSLGVFAGLFAVPLQVFLQARPPAEQKGRTIGAMNLLNWIGILLSSGFYLACDHLLSGWGLPRSGIFLLLAGLMLPLACCYRPADVPLR